MKLILRAIIGMLLLIVANTWAMDIQGSHSGSWFNKDQSGHGFNFEVLNKNKMVVYWFVYTPDGEPTFLVALADIDGDTAHGTLLQHSGMHFGEFDPATLNEDVWGTLTVTFWDCDSATVTYQSTATHNGIPYGAGQVDLIRLTSIDGLNCMTQFPVGTFGSFSTGNDSFVWILGDGTLAYQAASNGGVLEIGYGHLTMTGETTFDYEVTTSDGSRSGTGMYEDGQVTLDLEELGVLSEPLDPSFHDEITYEDLAGDYSGPDAIFFTTVDDKGEFSGFSIGGDIWGTLTIPEPGLNQLVQELRFDGGVNQGVGIRDQVSGNLLFIWNRGSVVGAIPWFKSN